ncbi:LysR family transcriptional regulator [Actinoplanes solisilvae]|uniref:LysR family transcriptional regulator n=1 Tax=Actinoplanes solisilvae TaxID=2486853 RepID=UPI000FD9C2DE|nr:LysR family transcriptional regulator [Actinoplanes solisilvae]
MESRALGYFVAVAEELNFTRAAARLGMSVPPLSRAIRRLESDLGVTLFARSPQRVSLTPAGETLLAEGRLALDALRAAARRTQRTETASLILAMKADGDAGLLDSLLTRYRADPDALPVTIRLCGWGAQPRLLLTGEADVALVTEPFDHTGLDTEVIHREPRVAAVASKGPLAARATLTPGDLGDPVIPDGVTDLAQLLTLIEMGRVRAASLPSSIRARYPRPGITYVDMPDAPPATLAIAWPAMSRSRATAALVRAAEHAALERSG